MKLLVVRPQPGADATAARVRAAGHEAVVMPLFAVTARDWQIPDPADYDALLLTSGNAVRMAGPGLQAMRELPACVVGSATARATQEAGLSIAVQGDEDVAGLLSEIKRLAHSSAESLRLLWLCGEDRIALPSVPHVAVHAVPVYESAALPAPANFAEAVEDGDAILLHSARAAAHFAALCDEAGLRRAAIRLAAFSPAIADAAGIGWRELLAAPEPNDAALLSLLAKAPRSQRQ